MGSIRTNSSFVFAHEKGFCNKFKLYKHQSFKEVQFISNCGTLTHILRFVDRASCNDSW